MLFQHDSSQRMPLNLKRFDSGMEERSYCQLLPPEAELLPERKLRPKDLSLPFHKLHSAH